MLLFNFQGETRALVQNDQKTASYRSRLEGNDVVRFQESGINFYISRRGDLYFEHRKIYCGNDGRILSRSFKEREVHRNYKGQIEGIGRVPISHDYRGRIDKIGKLTISYNFTNKIEKVGETPINYQFGKIRKVGQTGIEYKYGKVSKVCQQPFD